MNRINPVKNVIANGVEFIGMQKHKAFAACVEKNMSYRVVHENGQNFIITMDIRMDRVNFSINNDVITAYTIG